MNCAMYSQLIGSTSLNRQAFTLIKAPLGGTLALDQCEGDVDGGDDDDDVDVDDVDILIAGGK